MGNVERFYEYVKGILVNFRVKTCCCVAPLRVGILVLAYFNVAVSLVLIVGTASSSFVPMAVRVQEIIAEEASVSTCILAPIFDLAFSVVLVCAMHRKDLALLRVYCWYGLVAILGSFLVYSLVLPMIEALYLVVIVFSLTYQAYVLILVRSVMVEIRLENAAAKSQLYFDKNTERIILRDVETPIKAYAIIPQVEEQGKVEIKVVDETNQIEEPKYSVSKSNSLKIDTIIAKPESSVWKTSHYAIVHKPVVTTVDTVPPSPASTSQDISKDTTSKESKDYEAGLKDKETKVKEEEKAKVSSKGDSAKNKKDKDAKPGGKEKTTKDKKEKGAKSDGKEETTKGKKETDAKTDDKQESDKTDKAQEDVSGDVKIEEVPQKKKRGIFSRKPPKETKKNDS